MCTQVLCTQGKKKSMTGLQRGEEAEQCREGLAGGVWRKGQRAAGCLLTTLFQTEVEGSGVGNSEEHERYKSKRKMGRNWVEKMDEMTCKRSSLQKHDE